MLEDALGEIKIAGKTVRYLVLILIVLEDALGVVQDALTKSFLRLNPYCVGGCSWGSLTRSFLLSEGRVLILIVLEDALGDKVQDFIENFYLS